ncbi:MAG: nuclear transport factor 2 family protein [bacterium]
MSTTEKDQLIDKFKAFYKDIKNPPLDDIESIYTADVVFRDPVHEIRGIDRLHTYMTDLCANLNYGRFEFLDQLVGDDRAYIKWNMHFSHPRLGSSNIEVRGVSQIIFSDRIHYHEDIYDLGEMLYEHVPLLGSSTRWLKRRLAG